MKPGPNRVTNRSATNRTAGQARRGRTFLDVAKLCAEEAAEPSALSFMVDAVGCSGSVRRRRLTGDWQDMSVTKRVKPPMQAKGSNHSLVRFLARYRESKTYESGLAEGRDEGLMTINPPRLPLRSQWVFVLIGQ